MTIKIGRILLTVIVCLSSESPRKVLQKSRQNAWKFLDLLNFARCANFVKGHIFGNFNPCPDKSNLIYITTNLTFEPLLEIL